ncbi:hypothetical protein D3C75_886120 [compost metagenome]
MCPVEDRYLAFFIRFDVINDVDIQIQLIQMQLLRQPLRALDHKQVEMFRRIEEAILITQLLLPLIYFIAWVARDDTIDQR